MEHVASAHPRRGGATGSDGPPARSAAGWPGRGTSSAAASPAAVWLLPAAAAGRGLAPRSASASISSLLCDIHHPGRDPVRGRTGRLTLGGLPCPGGAPSHVREQAETHRHDLTPSRRRGHRRGISHSLSGEPGRAQTAARRSPAAQARRHNPASGPGPDVRRRPRARPPGKTGAQCHDHGLRGDQAAGERRRAGREDETIGDRTGAQRRLGPVPGRRPAHLVVPASSGSVPSLLHRAMAPVGSSSTPTPTGPSPTSHSRPEQVIQGRLFDLIGRPVQGVEVRVQSMGRAIPGNRASLRGSRGPRFGGTPGTACRPGPSRRSATPRADSPSAAWAGISGSSS